MTRKKPRRRKRKRKRKRTHEQRMADFRRLPPQKRAALFRRFERWLRQNGLLLFFVVTLYLLLQRS